MNALVMSGGATKIVGQYGIVEQIYKDYKPEIIAGNSAGAILSFLLPTINWENGDDIKIKDALLNLQPKNIWKINPSNSKGGMSFLALIRGAFGYPSLGNMSKMKDFLASYVSINDFYTKIATNDDIKHLFVGSICYNTGHRAYIDIKNCTYMQALDWVLASASIPVYTPPFKYNEYYYYDGGVRDHNPGPWVLENYGKDITNLISVYSRPADYNMIDQKWSPKNAYKVLERTIEILQVEISKSDEIEERLLAKESNVNLSQLFLPNVLDSLYDMKKENLLELYKQGVKIGKSYNEKINQ